MRPKQDTDAPLITPNPRAVAAAAGPPPAQAASLGAGKGLIGLSAHDRDSRREARKLAFLNAVDYFTKLSALNKEKASDALLAAIMLVDKRSEAAKLAIASLGGGLGAAAKDLRLGSLSLRDRVRGLEGGVWGMGFGVRVFVVGEQRGLIQLHAATSNLSLSHSSYAAARLEGGWRRRGDQAGVWGHLWSDEGFDGLQQQH